MPRIYVFRAPHVHRIDLPSNTTASMDVDASGLFVVRIEATINETTHPDTVADLDTMRAHLLSGGSVGFALDAGKAWAAPVTIADLAQGATALSTTTNAYASWEAGAVAPVVGEYLAFDPEAPIRGYEVARVLARPGSAPGVEAFTMRPARHRHNFGALVRCPTFWPSLYLRSIGPESVYLFGDGISPIYHLRAAFQYVPNDRPRATIQHRT